MNLTSSSPSNQPSKSLSLEAVNLALMQSAWKGQQYQNWSAKQYQNRHSRRLRAVPEPAFQAVPELGCGAVPKSA